MKKASKPFKVEVKRKAGKASTPFLPPLPDEGASTAPMSAAMASAVSKFDKVTNGASHNHHVESELKRIWPTDDHDAHDHAEGAGRVLPCLVSEAAVETAHEQSLVEAEERLTRERAPGHKRGVGRPRKVLISSDDAPPPAPKKRGRPRGAVAVAPPPSMNENFADEDFDLDEDDAFEVRAPASLSGYGGYASEIAPAPSSARARRRTIEVSALPRGQRWKRRLPKTLR